LAYAEKEVKYIARSFKGAEVYTGNKATEKRFKERAYDFRWIHLATHYLVDDAQPMYSKIMLAQSEADEEDGMLQTYEIYNLQLNADMVVLSGCNTGLGKMIRGEGLLGIARAFQYAGASSLLVSLWPVEDETTAYLMQSFYRNLKNGGPKNEALQKAKIELIHSNDAKNNPFYWGPFVLMGR
jgi:CHAT domain-containing protein